MNFILTWSENSVITSKAKTDANTDTNPVVAEIKIKETEFHVSVVLYHLKMIINHQSN